MIDVQITEVTIRIVVSLALVASVIVGGCSNSSSDDSIYPASVSSGTDTRGQTNVGSQNNSTSGTTTVNMSSSSVDNSKSTATDTSSGSETGTNSSTNSGSKSVPNSSSDRSSTQAISSPSNTGTGNTELVWRRKYYFKSSVYDACAFPEAEKPRTVNAGTEAHELFFLRSKLEENSYLGKQTIDINPYDFTSNSKNFSDHLKNMTRSNSYYHELLKSTQSFRSLPKSKYSHAVSLREYINRTNLVEAASFGIIWEIVEDGSGLEIFVKYGSRGVKRGDRLLQIGDIRIDSVTDATTREKLFEELFPVYDVLVSKYQLHGEEKNVEFVFSDYESEKIKKISLLSRYYIMPEFPYTKVLLVDGRKVSYINVNDLKLRGRYASGVSNWAYSKLKWIYSYPPHEGVSDMILDLRYAETGTIEFASQLAFMITGEGASKGKSFGTYDHNSDHLNLSHYNRVVPFINACRKLYPCRPPDLSTWDFWYYDAFNRIADDYARKLEPVFNLDRVFILTSEETCGVSEVLINSLVGIDFDVILIGTGTCGKPYHGSYYGSCGIRYFVPEFRFLNHKKFGDYIDGFRPENSPFEKGIPVKGCYVEEDLTKQLGSEDENLLAAALQYRKDGTCPALPENPVQSASSEYFPRVW